VNSHSLRLERNATMMLRAAADECNEMHHDMYQDSLLPDMDTVYTAAEEMRRFADRLNHWADALMKEYRTADSLMIDFDNEELRNESFRTA